MRWVLKPVLIASVCLAALFSAAVVVRADTVSLTIIDGSPDWFGQEPPSPDPPDPSENRILALRVVGSDMKWKGALYAKCSLIQRTDGGSPLNNARLKYSCNNGPYTQFTQDPGWGIICEVSKDGFTVNVDLAPFLLTTDPPGLYEATVTFEYRAQNNNSIVTLPPLRSGGDYPGSNQSR